MKLTYTAEQEAFRQRVREFLASRLPGDIRDRILRGEPATAVDIRAWQKILHSQGWGGSAWPLQFGGPGWSPIEQSLFELECAVAGAPAQLAFGVKMVAPVIMRYGTPTQQERFLPRILNGDDWWCQGYSEPGAGSDLASLKTAAKLAGDAYIVNGMKCWNTLGQHADWIFCLVRTDSTGKPQRGISFLLIDMKSPGITVRPTVLLDGTPEVNEIWFDNVVVPVENRIGVENEGWTYAKYLLGHERTNIAGVGVSKRELRRLKAIAASRFRGGHSLLEDPLFSVRIAQLEAELNALEITNLRVICASDERRASGPEASILKIKGTEITQAISELMVEAIGPDALPFGASGHPTAAYLNLRKVSIFGGSNEIQRNLIAQMILGS